MHHRTIWHFHLKHQPHMLDGELRSEVINAGVWRLFTKFALPSVFGMLLYAIYFFIDAIFVGQWVGKEALAAISIVYPITLLSSGILSFMGMGFASLVSRSIGSGDRNTFSQILSANTILVFLFSILFSIGAFIFAGPLVAFMGGRGNIKDLGSQYLRIVGLAAFLTNFNGSTNMLIRAEGKTKAAMILIGVGSLLNICLDIVFIKILGMGVEGAAVATAISMALTGIVTVLYLVYGESDLRFNTQGLRRAPRLLRTIAPVGLSGLSMQLMGLVHQSMLLKSVSHYGSGDDLALMGASLNMLAFVGIPLWGISQGLQPVIGINFGAGNNEKIKEAFVKFLGAATAIATLVWIVFMLFPSSMLRLYISDPNLTETGADSFRIFMAILSLQGISLLGTTYFQSIGKGSTASLILLFDDVILIAPFVLILPRFFGLEGIWISVPVSELLIALFVSIITIRALNKRKSND